MDNPQFVEPLPRRVISFKAGKFITVGKSLTEVNEDVAGLGTLLEQPLEHTSVDGHMDSASSGTQSRVLYRVLWGAVSIVVRDQVVCVLRNGDYFGELYAFGLESVSSVTARSAERGSGIEILEGAILPDVKKALSEVRSEDCLPDPSSDDLPLNANGASRTPRLNAHHYLYPRIFYKGAQLQLDNEDSVPIALVLLRYGSLGQDMVDEDGRVIRFRTIEAPDVLPMHSFFFLDAQPSISYHVTSTIALMYFLPKAAIPAILNVNHITRKSKPWTWFGGTQVPGMPAFSSMEPMTSRVSYLYAPTNGSPRRRDKHEAMRVSVRRWGKFSARRTGRSTPIVSPCAASVAEPADVSRDVIRQPCWALQVPSAPDPAHDRRDLSMECVPTPPQKISCRHLAPDTGAREAKIVNVSEKRETVRFSIARACTPSAHELLARARASLLHDNDDVSELSQAARKAISLPQPRETLPRHDTTSDVPTCSGATKKLDGTPHRISKEGSVASGKKTAFRWSKKAGVPGVQSAARPTMESLTYMWSLFQPDTMDAATSKVEKRPSTPLTVAVARHKAASEYISVLDLFNCRGFVPEFVVHHVEERVVCPNTTIKLCNMLVLIAQGSCNAYSRDDTNLGTFGAPSAFGAIPSLCLAANPDVAYIETTHNQIAFIMVIYPQVVLHAMTVDALGSASRLLAHFMPHVCVLPCERILPYMLCSERGGLESQLFLRNASVQFIRLLAAHAELRFYIPGDHIVREGDISDVLLLLLRPNEPPRILQEANMLGLHTQAPETVEVVGDTPWGCYVISHSVFATMLERSGGDDFRVLRHLFACFFPTSMRHTLVAFLHLDAHREHTLLQESEIFVALPGTVDTSRGPIVLACGRAVVAVEDRQGREELYTLGEQSKLFYGGELPLKVCAMTICVFLQLSQAKVGMKIMAKQSEEAQQCLSIAINKRIQDKLITQLHLWPYPTDKSLLKPYFRAWRGGALKPRVKKEFKRSTDFLEKQNVYLSKLVSTRFQHKALLGYVTHRGSVGIKYYDALKRSYGTSDKSAKMYSVQSALCSTMKSVYDAPPLAYRTPRAHASWQHTTASVDDVDARSRHGGVLDEPSAREVESLLPPVHMSQKSVQTSQKSVLASPRGRKKEALVDENMWHKCNSHVLGVLSASDTTHQSGATANSPWLLPNR